MAADTIQHSNAPIRAAARLVPALLAILLAGAVVYYKERMLFIDAPHVFFRVLNDGHLHIEEHRLGSFITQAVPLLGGKLHLPFRWLLVLYSASFYIFYLAVALLLVYRFRMYGLAVAMGLYFTLFVSATYYWPNNEVHQGIAWLMLAFAVSISVASKGKPFLLSILLFTVLFYIAVWTHPLAALVAIYLWVFLWLRKSEWPFTNWQSAGLTLILILLVYLKYQQGTHSGYDSSKIETVANFDIHTFHTILKSPHLHQFMHECATRYWLTSFLFLAGTAEMLWARRYLPLIWTLLFTAGYLTLVFITFPNTDAPQFYIESEYMPLTLITCAPFAFYVLPRIQTRWAVVSLVAIFAVRLFAIQQASKPFVNRVAIMDAMLNRMRDKGLTKVFLPDPDPWIDSALIMNWGAPVESMFLSKLKGDAAQRTFVFVPAPLFPFTMYVGNDTLLGCWEKKTYSNMNLHYFRFDTTRPYTVMDYETLMK